MLWNLIFIILLEMSSLSFTSLLQGVSFSEYIFQMYIINVSVCIPFSNL